MKKDDKIPVTFRMEPDVRKSLDKYLETHNVKIANAINLALHAFLEMLEKSRDEALLKFLKRSRQ